MQMNDFPSALDENLHFGIMKLLTVFTRNFAAVANAYFLLTFPLTAITALYTFRKLSSRWIGSIVGSLLFTFLPYHFFRGQHHLSLAGYYMLPLVIGVAIRLASAQTMGARQLFAAGAICAI